VTAIGSRALLVLHSGGAARRGEHYRQRKRGHRGRRREQEAATERGGVDAAILGENTASQRSPMTGRCASTLVVLAFLISACDVQRGAEPATPKSEESAPEAKASRRKQEAAPPPRRSLEGEPAPAEAVALESLQRIDLAAALSNGELTIEVNDASAKPSIPAMIDGDPDNLLKTDSVNPLLVTLTFRAPIQLRAARAYMVASPYDWLLEAQPGEQRLLATNVPDRQWSQISLPAAVETSVVRIEILRLERDDYVHANEIELYGPAAP
jgi:hypothetical protein